ncbi:conjugal transfer protein TraG N-terminal domain-containing protein [Acinetobacter baumannii]|uniref:conjugal transfer protein TraG N-terminal domain-containing protein n=2 Tax=Acinetobacter baumannii TaxID=470 RepID=UPI00338FE226
MDFEVITFAGGDWLRMIFNSVAMIFGNGDYWLALRTLAVATFTGILLKVTFSRDGLHNVRYMLVLVFFIYAVLIPKVNVVITDKAVPSNSAVVANVPIGLAGIASVGSRFSFWLAKAVETTTTLPDQAKYTQTGFGFYSELMNSFKGIRITNPNTIESYRQFFNSCIIVDGIGHKRFTFEELMNAGNLDQFLKTHVNNNVAGFTYTSSTGDKSFQYCVDGYNLISQDLTGSVNDAIRLASITFTDRYKSVDSANQLVQNSMTEIMRSFTNIALSKEAISKQYMLYNELDSSVSRMAAEVSDDSMQNYIIAKANLERQTTFNAVGKVAADKLPILKIILEGIIYGSFPLVVMIALVAPAPVSITYAKVVIWIALWTPLFAFLHFGQTYFAANHLQSLASLNNGLSPNAISGLNHYLSEASDTAGYLMVSLPIIAWLFVSASGAMLASLTTRFAQGYEKSAESAASETVDGKGSANGRDWKYEQQAESINSTMPAASFSPSLAGAGLAGANVSSVLNSGTGVTTSSSNNVQMSQPKSDLYVSNQAAQQYAESTTASLQKAQSYVSSTQQSLTESISATLSQTQAAVHKIMNSDSMSTAAKHAVSEAMDNSRTSLTQSMSNWGKANGFNVTDEMSGRLGLSFFGSSAGAGVGALNTEEQRFAQAYMTSTTGQAAISNAVSNVNETIRNSTQMESDETSSGIQSSLDRMKQASTAYSQALSRKEEASWKADIARTNAESMTTDQTDRLLSHAIKEGYSPAQYDQLIRNVRDGDSAAIAQYGSLVESANMKMDGHEAIAKSYENQAEKIATNGKQSLIDSRDKYEDRVIAQHAENDGHVASQSVAQAPNMADPTAQGKGGGNIGNGTDNAHLTSITGKGEKAEALYEKTGEQANAAAHTAGSVLGTVVKNGPIVNTLKVGEKIGKMYDEFKSAYNSSSDDPMDGNRKK